VDEIERPLRGESGRVEGDPFALGRGVGRAGQADVEGGQNAGLMDEIERPLGSESGLVEGDPLAFGGAVGQACQPDVEKRDRRG
jgi:hypothetical protein